MRKLFLVLFLSFLALVGAAQATHTLGYCTDDLEGADMVGVDEEARISGAIHLPATVMQRYKDGHIIRIKVALRDGIEKPSVWVRTSLTESSKVVQSISHLEYGWNEVTLNNPLTIDGSDLYIGFTFTQPAGVKGVLAKGDGTSDTSLLAIDNEWDDYHSQGLGILYIQAIVEADMPSHDLGLISIGTDSLCYGTGSQLQATTTIECLGALPMSGYTLTWSVDGETVSTVENDVTLSAGETLQATYTFDLSTLDEGEHAIEATILSSGEDEKPANNTLSTPFYVYTTPYGRKVLLEHFTSLPCVNCPPVDQLIESVVKTRDDVVWVSHHVGFRNDEFTIEASEPYVRFGVEGNPYIMLDRSQVDGGTPAFIVGAYTAEELSEAFDGVASRPALVTLNASLDADGRHLTTEVSGEAKTFFKNLYPRATLNVFVVEDDVLAEGRQVGDTNKKRHDHITRAILTRQAGDLLSWTGDTSFSQVYTTEAEEAWDLSHLRVVAFVTAAADRSTGYPTGEVLNTTQVFLDSTVGITTPHADSQHTPCYYTLGGQPMYHRPTTPGIYIVDDGHGCRQKIQIIY